MDVMMRRRELMGMQGRLKTVSGHIVTINDALARNAKSLIVNFAPIQAAGTPSPDNVLPISGWTGVTGYRTGKNLFNYLDSSNWRIAETSTNRVKTSAHGTIYEQNNIVIADRNSDVIGLSFILGYLRANTAYTFSATLTNSDGKAYIAKIDGDTITDSYTCTRTATIIFSHGVASFTPNNDGIYEVLIWKQNMNAITATDVMFELGTTATPYAPYTGTTYPVTFPAVGKNLFNTEIEQGSFTPTDGTEAIAANRIRSTAVALNAGTYTISQAENLLVVVYVYNANNVFDADASVVNWQSTPYTFTLANNALVRFAWRNSGQTNITPTDISQVQLEKGSTATAYEPYTNTIYGGYVDLVSGVLVAEYGTVDLGTLTWTQGVNYTTRYSTPLTFGNVKQPSAGTKANAICDAYNVAKTPTYMQENTLTSGEFCIGRPGVNSLFMQNDSYNDAASFKASLNGTKLVYELSTPITYQLTPQTVAMLAGTNNVWSNANGNVELTYYAQ